MIDSDIFIPQDHTLKNSKMTAIFNSHLKDEAHCDESANTAYLEKVSDGLLCKGAVNVSMSPVGPQRTFS